MGVWTICPARLICAIAGGTRESRDDKKNLLSDLVALQGMQIGTGTVRTPRRRRLGAGLRRRDYAGAGQGRAEEPRGGHRGTVGRSGRNVRRRRREDVVKTRVRGPMERLSWRLRLHRGGNLVEHGVGRPSCWRALSLCNLRGLPVRCRRSVDGNSSCIQTDIFVGPERAMPTKGKEETRQFEPKRW